MSKISNYCTRVQVIMDGPKKSFRSEDQKNEYVPNRGEAKRTINNYNEKPISFEVYKKTAKEKAEVSAAQSNWKAAMKRFYPDFNDRAAFRGTSCRWNQKVLSI